MLDKINNEHFVFDGVHITKKNGQWIICGNELVTFQSLSMALEAAGAELGSGSLINSLLSHLRGRAANA